MPNAFKTPSPSTFQNEIRGPGKEKKSNYKKLLFFMFSGLLLGAVFKLYPNQVEIKELFINSLEKPAAVQTKHQEKKPLLGKTKVEPTQQDSASEPVQPEPLQRQTAGSPFKDGKKEFAFKRDKEYLAMNRFERPSLDPTVSKVPMPSVRDTVAVADKPLALAGRGFEIKGFQSHSKTRIEADFLRHLKRPVPKMDQVPQDHLDLQFINAKSSKHLIFHPSRPALSELPGHSQWEDSEFQMMKPKTLETIPETKLLFKENKKSTLILQPGSKSMDLLIGNEKLNRKEYDRW